MTRPRVIFVGPLPPPRHGMAVVNAEMVAMLQTAADLRVAPVRPDASRRKVAYHLTKSISAARAMAAIVGARLGGTRVLYLSADDGWGGVWTLAFVLLGRITGMRIYLHHHSYRYIVAPTRLMGAIVWALAARNAHVMLSDGMVHDFSAAYPAARKFLVVPNAVSEPANLPLGGDIARPLTIGMLSNLTFDKGTADFVGILEAALARGVNVRGILAGPAATVDVEHFLQTKLGALAGRLEWSGAVEGEAKEAFFAAIDLFVFPTRYRTEALPLVIMEALVRGRPVIAPARGCIASYAANRAATILPLDSDIVETTLERLASLSADRVALAALKLVAYQDGVAMNAAFHARREALVRELTRSDGGGRIGRGVLEPIA